MTEYSKLLGAFVERAFAARGTDASRAACEAIIEFHTAWPLIEFEIEVKRGLAEYAAEMAARNGSIEKSTELLRRTYV